MLLEIDTEVMVEVLLEEAAAAQRAAQLHEKESH